MYQGDFPKGPARGRDARTYDLREEGSKEMVRALEVFQVAEESDFLDFGVFDILCEVERRGDVRRIWYPGKF